MPREGRGGLGRHGLVDAREAGLECVGHGEGAFDVLANVNQWWWR